MKYWDNAKGSGNLFNIHLSDAVDSCRMLATFYCEAADYWYERLQKD